jgi:hypothetical protein
MRIDDIPVTLETRAKPMRRSKTFWVNAFAILTLLATIGADVLDLLNSANSQLHLPPQFFVWFGIVLAVANIFLRRITELPIRRSTRKR